MQKVTLIGNLGIDPEERFTSSGKKVITFSLAVAAGKEVVVWYQVNIWEEKIPLFQGMVNALKKGSKICLIGDLGAPKPYINKSQEPCVRLSVQPLSMTFVGLMSGDKKTEVENSVLDVEVPF